MPPVHNSTISRCMSKHLGLSYKKLELKRPPALTLLSYRKWLESVLIQIELEKRDVEIIYIDEFLVNILSHRFRGWTKKSEKDFITVDSKDFSMSFFWALSKTRVLGLMGKEETNKSEIMKHYLKCMFQNLNNRDISQDKRTIIVWDNAPVHTSNATIEFIRSAKLRVLSIPPYTPSLNPAEKLINAIKIKLKKFQANGE